MKSFAFCGTREDFIKSYLSRCMQKAQLWVFSLKMLLAGVFKYLQPLPISSQGVKFLFCGSLAHILYSSSRNRKTAFRSLFFAEWETCLTSLIPLSHENVSQHSTWELMAAVSGPNDNACARGGEWKWAKSGWKNCIIYKGLEQGRIRLLIYKSY